MSQLKFELFEKYEIIWEDSLVAMENPIAQPGWQEDKGAHDTKIINSRMRSMGYVRSDQIHHVEIVSDVSEEWFGTGRGIITSRMSIPKRAIIGTPKKLS